MPLTYGAGSTAEIPQVEAECSAACAHPAQRQGLTLSGVQYSIHAVTCLPLLRKSVTWRGVSEQEVGRRTRTAVRGHILRSH